MVKLAGWSQLDLGLFRHAPQSLVNGLVGFFPKLLPGVDKLLQMESLQIPNSIWRKATRGIAAVGEAIHDAGAVGVEGLLLQLVGPDLEVTADADDVDHPLALFQLLHHARFILKVRQLEVVDRCENIGVDVQDVQLLHDLARRRSQTEVEA